MLKSCKSCNSEEAKPPNPRYQVQPGNEILEPEALVKNGARSEYVIYELIVSVATCHSYNCDFPSDAPLGTIDCEYCQPLHCLVFFGTLKPNGEVIAWQYQPYDFNENSTKKFK
ncbi:hypothetical protein SAMD00079811_35290 [Scytonema sp. HK-05]|nr:hypothetical protein NIES2130_33485 [Scytonema sp. HK-05]BAY45922.1 hypothetical protein SAMD00079811_35290 [Scytonema sp. HK-05]